MTKNPEETVAAAPVDLADLNPAVHAAKPFRYEIKHPVTMAGTGQYVWLMGDDAPAVRQYMRDEADAEMAREAHGKEDAQTVAMGERRAITKLCVATVKWENVFFNGKAADFTVPAAQELYKQEWIRAQLLKAMGKLENFMSA